MELMGSLEDFSYIVFSVQPISDGKAADMNIYAIVVIYNKSCEDSITCRCLKHASGCLKQLLQITARPKVIMKHLHTTIVQPTIINKELATDGRQKRITMPLIWVKGTDAMVCLFDDDSEVSAEYFDGLRRVACAIAGNEDISCARI